MTERTQILPAITAGALSIALALIFFYAPREAVQGDVQRIFYIHVPSAWIAYLAFIIVAGASILVLARRNDWERWDKIAVAAAELGLVFTTIVLTTGPIWARRAWGIWWAWDARLTSTLVLWLIYAGYLLFRANTAPGERRARLSAVVGIVAAVDIPVIHFAVVWWTTQHPAPTVLNASGPQLPSEMLLTLFVSLAAFTLLFTTLLVLRIDIESARTRLELIDV